MTPGRPKNIAQAYKSLDAYKYFVAGWVRCFFVGKATDNIKILIGKVGFFFFREIMKQPNGLFTSHFIIVNHMTWHSHFFIALMQVNHSQRMNETPLKPWVAGTNKGTVVTAHYNCVAGLGGACSHVGAILFAVETGVRIKRPTTVPCKWLMPTPVIAVSYQEL